MPKRFTSTEIWDEDWFLDMPIEYKLFWFYVMSACDYAGIFKVNLRSFCGLQAVKINPEKALELFNTGKERIRVINKTVWLIEDFFVFQYGPKFNINNPLHKGVVRVYDKYEVKLTSIRGLLEESIGLKEKDKEIDVLSLTNKKINGKQLRNFKSQGEDILAERIAARTQKVANANRKKDYLSED